MKYFQKIILCLATIVVVALGNKAMAPTDLIVNTTASHPYAGDEGTIEFTAAGTATVSGPQIVPSITMTSAGTLSADSGAVVTVTAITGTGGSLTLGGSGKIILPNTASTVLLPANYAGRVRTAAGFKFGVSTTEIGSGAALEIGASTANAVPGDTTILSGGTLEVGDGIDVPVTTVDGDIFDVAGAIGTGGLKFEGGAKLKLGAGSVWRRDIALGTKS